MMEPADRARPEVSAPRPATTPTGARAAVEQLRAAGSARLGLSDLIPLLTAYGIPVLTPRRAQSYYEQWIAVGTFVDDLRQFGWYRGAGKPGALRYSTTRA